MHMDTLTCAEATSLWLIKAFNTCQATLQKIESEGISDPKLAHNLLVVEHTINGSGDAERIALRLKLIYNDKLTADDGSCPSAGASGSAEVGAGGSTSRSRSTSSQEPLPLIPVRDDVAVAQLNRAILLYHQHRYASAAALLEPLAFNVEALAEGTAVRVITLLMDIYIENRQLPQAVALQHCFERMYSTLEEVYSSERYSPGNTPPGGSRVWALAVAAAAAGVECAVGEQPRSLALPRVSRWFSGIMKRSKLMLEIEDRPVAAPNLKLIVKLYRSRIYALANNTRASKRELYAVTSAVIQQSALQEQQGSSGHPAAALGQSGEGQQEQGMSLGGAAPVPVPASTSATAMLLSVRAQLELYRGRSRKAMKMLLGMMMDPLFSSDHWALLLNNLGLAHHQQGKHALALLYLSQALAADAGGGLAGVQEAREEAKGQSISLGAPGSGGVGAASTQVLKAPGEGHLKPPQQQQKHWLQSAGRLGKQVKATSPGLVPVAYPAMMYNAGLQHLMLQNYEAARRCFEAAAPHYLNTPLLWLRTAEAALGIYRRYEQQEQHRRQKMQAQGPTSSATAVAAAAASATPGDRGGVRPLVGEGVLLGSSAAEVAPGQRLLLPTGEALDAKALLREAVVALQAALQQLDAQQEAYEQWQSSRGKLREGLALRPPPLPSPAAITVTPATPSGGSSGGSVLGSAAEAQTPAISMFSRQISPDLHSLPQHQQLPPLNHANVAQQPMRQLNDIGGASQEAGLPPSHQPSIVRIEPHEPHGTDASTPLSEELCSIRRAVLANLSYAHLQIEDWCSALQVARALLAISSTTTTAGLLAATTLNSTDSVADSSPPAATDATAAAAASSLSSSSFPSMSPTCSASAAAEYAFLAHSYAAEALCHLDRPADAVEYLSLWLMIAQEREVPPGQQHQQQQGLRHNTSSRIHDEDASVCPGSAPAGSSTSGSCPREEQSEQYSLGNVGALAALSGPAALATTATNLGAVFASQGEFQQAAALARQALSLQPSSQSAALLLIYCELAAGNTSTALALLKQGATAVTC